MLKNEKGRSLKQSNRYIILNTLRGVQDISIAGLARFTELSKPTIKKVLDHFIEQGLVCEVGKGSSTEEGGKRPLLYSFNADYSRVIAIHLGPNFIISTLLNFRGEVVKSESVELGAGVSFTEVINELVGHIHGFSAGRKGCEISAIVLALPGIVDPVQGRLRYSPHFDSWESVEFRREIEQRIGRDIPIYVDNVNRYQTFAEMHSGKAVGVDNFAVIDVLEEGVGSGLILEGRLKHGKQNLAGEIGHTIVNTAGGAECICGGVGCFEAEVSWKNVYRLIETGRQQYPDSALFQQERLSLQKLFDAARGADKLALMVMDKVTTYFARGINNLVLATDPELIIIQGVYNAAGEGFIQQIKHKVDSLSLVLLRRDIRIVFSDFGMDRGIHGAGMYWISRFFEEDSLYE